MGTRACMLLFAVLFCSAIEVILGDISTTDKYSMSDDILNDRLNLKANNVIKYIWEKEPHEYCDIKKPSDTQLNDKTFILYTFIPYLCVILYDVSLRYMSLSSDSHFDQTNIDPRIAEKIVNATKKETFCQNMKNNDWSTTIEENKLWVSNFNASMKDGSSCQRYCEGGVVNPLCAYALWLDISTKRTSSKLTSESTTGQLLSAVPNNRKAINKTVEEKYSNSNMNNHLDTPSMKEQEVKRLTGSSVSQQNGVPSPTDNASRTITTHGSDRSSVQHSSSTKNSPVATSPHVDLVQSNTAIMKNDENVSLPASQENAGTPHSNVNNHGNTGFVQAVIHANSDMNKPNKTPVQDHRASSNDTFPKMEPPKPPMKSPQTNPQSLSRPSVQGSSQSTLGQTSNEQQTKLSEGMQTVSSTTPVESGTSGLENTQEKPNPGSQGNSQNLLSQGEDHVNLLHEEQQPEVPEDTSGTGKGKVISAVPGTVTYEDPAVNDEQAEKGNTPSPQSLEQSNVGSEDQMNGGMDDGISDTPDNHEEQKAMDEGTIANKGDEGESIGGANKAPDQAADTDDEDDDDDDEGHVIVSDEPRFNGESDDPGGKMNSSPRRHDYGEGPSEDDDVINEEQEKGPNDVGVGRFPHERFVDAEDSHFFAYFMTMVILCIIGYLIFHNKQKILALALEGRVRKGTRRRPSTSGYRKLDSNLEEAVTSNFAGPSVTHVIY